MLILGEAERIWPEFLGDYLGLSASGGSVHLLYAAAPAGDLDVFSQRVDWTGVFFADGFETGDTSRWTNTVP